MVTLAGVTATAPAANAQDTTSAKPIDQLEEVVVTARKRAENLQKTPISITAFTSDMLQNRQIFNVKEIAQDTPNLQFSSGASGLGSSSNFYIRGIGQDDFITTTEPGVGVYLDGVYLARVTGAALDLADVKRVEVLRGPQGTLFGRNTIGGAVSVITAKPTGVFGGKATARVGSNGAIEGFFTADFPIVSDTLAAKVSVLGRSYDGYGRNNWPGPGNHKLGADATTAGRLQLRYTPTSKLTVDFAADYTNERGTTLPHGMVHFTPSAASAAFNAVSPVPIGPQWLATNPNNINVNTAMGSKLHVWGVMATATYDFDFAKLKLISAYRAQKGHNGQDYDGTPAPYLDQLIDYRQHQFSQELQLTGTSFNDKLNWLFGLYYFTETGQFNSNVVLQLIPIQIYTGNTTDSYAAFGQATYHLTDKLSLTAGVRYTTENKSITANTYFGGFNVLPLTTRKDNFNAWSPKGGIEYQLTDETMLYASVTRGFRSGGFNGRAFSLTDLTPFKAETDTSYEAGFKTEFAKKRVRLNGAVFYNDYTNIQLTAVTTDKNGHNLVVTGNAAQAKIYGFEAELTAIPVDALQLHANVGYLHDTLKENPGFTFGSTELPNAPNWNLNVGADYSFMLADYGSLTIGGQYSYRGGFFPQFNNSGPSYIDARGLFDAHITLTPNQGNWVLSLYGKNLTNKLYATYGQTAGTNDTTIKWFGRPREFGAELRFKF